jgi:hypothetical protein
MRGRSLVLASFLLLACGGGSTTAEVTHPHDAPSGESSVPDAQSDTLLSDAGPDQDAAIDANQDAAIDAPVTDCDGGQPFADPAIEAAVRDRLTKPTGAFTRDELAQVTAIRASGAGSLTGVQCLTALEVLTAYDGTLEDLAPLRGLEKLRSVILERNRIQSLLPLSGLPLRTIRVSSNRIASLAGLVLSPGTCGHELRVERNPIGSADVQPFCDLEWVVSWGGADGGNPESCNALCP